MNSTSGLRILHIDDLDMNLLVMDQLLAALGHIPTGARSGEEAFRLMETVDFDLVFTDYHMPNVSGLEFLKTVRAMREPARSTPIVVVTADVMSWPSAALRDLGFAGALAKPIMADTIRRVIASAMTRTDPFIGEGFARG